MSHEEHVRAYRAAFAKLLVARVAMGEIRNELNNTATPALIEALGQEHPVLDQARALAALIENSILPHMNQAREALYAYGRKL